MHARLTSLILIFTVAASAQAPAPSSDTTETAAQTISKALADQASTDPKDRERAVLVLGKYNDPTATNALIRALRDPAARIRQSALVYLIERRLLPDQAIATARMVGDSQVSIRRIASSGLQRILTWYWRMGMMSAVPNNRGLPTDLQKILIKACDDTDSTVRKSMVASWSLLKMCGIGIDKKLIIRRLRDDNREVRILTLQSATHMLPPEKFAAAALPMTADKDRLIRLNLAKILGQFPIRATEPILKKLITDSDFEVSTQALVALLRRGAANHWPELRKRLDDRRTRSELAKTIISALPYIPTGRQELLKLMKHDRSTYRLIALEIYGTRYWDGGNPGIAFDLQADPSAAIRKAAGALLRKASSPLPAANVKALSASKYADVRRLALIMCSNVDRQTAEDVAMELLLDDDAETRRNALLLIAVKKFKGWEDIMADSLEDDDQRIRQQAVIILINEHPQKADKILDTFLKTGKDAALKKFIIQQRAIYGARRRNTIPPRVPNDIQPPNERPQSPPPPVYIRPQAPSPGR